MLLIPGSLHANDPAATEAKMFRDDVSTLIDIIAVFTLSKLLSIIVIAVNRSAIYIGRSRVPGQTTTGSGTGQSEDANYSGNRSCFLPRLLDCVMLFFEPVLGHTAL